MADNYSFKAATLSSIVLLKLISYDDRPERRGKDPRDIAGIIRDFFHLQSELIYEHHSDLFIKDDDLELTDISAIVIGREIKKICSNNTALCNRIEKMLSDEIRKNQISPFLRQMQKETSSDIELMKMWLEKLLMGLTQF
jgi:predicted nucleotidyltransferase